MASSTTIPRTRMNPKTVMVEIVRSVKGTIARVPIIATGIPMATHMAKRNCRNKARITSTSIKPPAAFFNNTDIRSCSSKDVSIQILVLMPSGNSSLNCLTISLVSAAIAIRSSLPTCETLTITAGAPLNAASRSPSSNESLISASSPSVTRVPSSRVITTMSENSVPR